MQQTVDADAKDQITTDADLEIVLVSGLSCFSFAVAEMASADVADVAMTAAYGSSSYCSAVAVSVETEADMIVDAVAITAATNFIEGVCFCRLLTYFSFVLHIFF